MSARIFSSGPLGEPRSAVVVHRTVDEFRDEVAAADHHHRLRPPLLDWEAEDDGPLTAITIELALAPAFAHPADSVQAAARVARRHLEHLLAEGTHR